MHVIAKQYDILESMTLACTYLRGAPLRWITSEKFVKEEVFRLAFKKKYAPVNEMKLETQLSRMRMLPGEKVRRYTARLNDLITKMEDDIPAKRLARLFTQGMPEGMYLFVKARGRDTFEEYLVLAEEYEAIQEDLKVRRSDNEEANATQRWKPDKKKGRCFYCKNLGHFKSECRKRKADMARTGNQGQKPKHDISKIKCFNCGQMGHYKNKCPNKKTASTTRSFLKKTKKILRFEDEEEVATVMIDDLRLCRVPVQLTAIRTGTFPCLFDSGASISLMSKATALKIGAKLRFARENFGSTPFS